MTSEKTPAAEGGPDRPLPGGSPLDLARDAYAGRAAELSSLAAHGAALDASGVHALLVAAGDLLRRTQALGVARGDLDAALRRLPRERVSVWASRVDLERLGGAVARACDHAVLAALADGDSERAEHVRASFDALAERDTLESALAALARFEELTGAAAGHGRDELVRRLAALDERWRASARYLVGCNPERRAERDLLDGPTRARAWWFHERTECDALVTALAGPIDAGAASRPSSESSTHPHLADCPACRADVTSTAWIASPPGRHIDEDELWRLEMGGMSAAERRRIERHAARCDACAAPVRAALEVDVADADE